GFQSEGSTGRQIVDGAKTVTIFGEKVAVRAKVFTIGGFSAHADQTGLLAWVGHFLAACTPHVYVVHGEPLSSTAFAEAVSKKLGLATTTPQRRDVLKLEKAPSVKPAMAADEMDQLRSKTLSLADEFLSNLDTLRRALAEERIQFSSQETAKLGKLRQELSRIIDRERAAQV
ncbi:MAG: MBL fold metallo-hydrolase RNA specificity domain-containing protein, partial [Desulfomonilaceae bacterium]